MKKELEDVLQILSQSLGEEVMQKYGGLVKEIREEYPHMDINNPEQCSLLLSFTIQEVAETFVKIALSSVELEGLKKEKMEFAYLHYDFIARHLEKVLTQYEGNFASADKSRWLISAYVASLTSDKLPLIEKREYWHPKKGEVEEWMKWIDSMYSLYFGVPETYIVSMMTILKHYQDKSEQAEVENKAHT